MSNEFVPLGARSPAEIAEKLREFEYPEPKGPTLESAISRPWLNTQHQYGFIPLFEPGRERFHKIVSASNMAGDETLKNQRINIRLEYLRIDEYPQPFLGLGSNVHTILFVFEARNQVAEGSEAVAFHQTYQARSGQDAAVTGYPIFNGLNVGANGVLFSCKTVNVGNSSDEVLVQAINSEEATLGLSLLTTAQPALKPFVDATRGLCLSLAERHRNVAVQKFDLGLDFETGATGARLAIGSYVVAQVSRANEINWSDWGFDAETGTIVRQANLAPGEEPYILPYNAVVFRVSQYIEPSN